MGFLVVLISKLKRMGLLKGGGGCVELLSGNICLEEEAKLSCAPSGAGVPEGLRCEAGSLTELSLLPRCVQG